MSFPSTGELQSPFPHISRPATSSLPFFENWESEFLQMSAYVVLTAFLFQRGSAESKDPDTASPQDAWPEDDIKNPDAPTWYVAAARRRQSTRIHWAWPYSLSSWRASLCIFETVPPRRRKRLSCMEEFHQPHGNISAALSSGLNPFRIGRANFSQPRSWLSFQFFFGFAVHPSRNRLQRLIRKTGA